MDPLATGAREGIHLLAAIRDFPLWVLAALALSFGLFLATPLSEYLPPGAKSWFVIGVVFFSVLTAFCAISRIPKIRQEWKAAADKHKKFHITANPERCWWGSAVQKDKSVNTQIDLSLTIRNRSQGILQLTHARLIKPHIKAEVLHEHLSVEFDGPHGPSVKGDLRIARTASVSVVMILKGTFPPGNVDAEFGIADDEGHEERVRLILKHILGSSKPPEPHEAD